MYRVAVLGDSDSIFAFAALGFDTFSVKDEEEARQVLKSLIQGQYAIIYITENYEAKLTDMIAKYNTSCIPAILTIPGIFGNTNCGVLKVKKMVEQAVGSDILFKEEVSL